ncbi:MAG TPA: serine hydrolase domain-containing protein [Candidatus Angelobacter sp.]|jgi:beta-lactamase class C|nr:serine hydrolase domain-containing protein [Candidatus Angelobacter sp.]
MRLTISKGQQLLASLTGGVSLVLMLAVPPAQAQGDRRVTVPIALPFQQSSNASSVASAATQIAPAHAVQATPFTQSPPSTTTVTIPITTVVGTASSASFSSAPPLALTAETSLSAMPLASTHLLAAQEAVAASSIASSAGAASSAALPPAQPIVAIKEAQEKSELAAAEKAQPAAQIPVITTAPIKAPRYPVGHPEAFVAEFEDYIAKKVAPFVPGVAVVIVSGGQIKSLNGYGVRRAGTRESITPDTVFRLASLSKSFAGTAASLLVDEGKITWDTTITSVLPNVAFKNKTYNKQITLRHALSQSSGLPRHTYSHYIDENRSYADIINRLRYVNFACPPGKCFGYQNVVYSLAGDMIKKKAGMSFENYVEKKIFTPLGMRSASYGLASYNASPNRAAPHISGGKRWVPTAVTPNWYRFAPAAGVNASIVDMSKFLLGQMGKRQEVLPLSVLNPIQTRVIKYTGHKSAVNSAYGIGWRVFDYGRNKNFVHHGGWVKGFRTEMVFNRDLQIGMVFLTNSETPIARDVVFKFIDSYQRAQAAARAAKKKK